MAIKEQYALLLGSDLGDRASNLELAVNQIAEKIGTVLKTSSVLETEPWGFVSDTKFLNQAILVESVLKPLDVLEGIQCIEKSIGRTRTTDQWSSRIIDIDILCAEDAIFHTSELTIPHKLLHQRTFALAPLCEIVDWQHPLLKINYAQILANLVEETTESVLNN